MLKKRMTERLFAVFNMIDKCYCIADIGTDHGILPAYSIETEKVKKAIVADISAPSLKKAELLFNSMHMGQSFESRLGDGLKVLKPGEADCIIIAGMGGVLISEMIDSSKDVARNSVLVLQPMNGVERLRDYLFGNGFDILREVVCREDSRFYNVFKVIYTGEIQDYGEYEKHLGNKKIIADEVYIEYLKFQMNKIQNILDNLVLSDNTGARRIELLNLLSLYERRYNEVIRTYKIS